MAFTIVTDPLAKLRSARTAVDTADLATLVADVFTRTASPIPVIPVKGAPNVAVYARTTNQGDAVGVTPVALVRDDLGNVSVLCVGSELVLTSGPPKDGTLFFTPVAFQDAMGTKGPAPGGSGPATHLAWLVTTAPTGARPVDLYSWSFA